MKTSFKDLLTSLKKVSNKYDIESEQQKLEFLNQLKSCKLPATNLLIDYQNTLLFLVAHPSNQSILSLAEEELNRLSIQMKRMGKKDIVKLDNTGLPFTKSISTFTHDLLKWYQHDHSISMKIDSFYNGTITLSDALMFTVPSLEKEVVSIGYKNNKLLEELKIDKSQQLSFLLSEFDKLEEQPNVKDYFFNGLHLYMQLLPKDKLFSKAYNRIKIKDHFYHTDIIKQFDQVELLNRKLPKARTFNANAFKECLSVVKNSLTLLQRETDPVTYLDEKSFRLYELERGISIAIYGMKPDRQLPLESYVGYTLFKNGLPAAYGGGWVFGKRSLFGINIFEPYRGGESGYMMCQLLRVYRQAFNVDYFEVEPYQYGLGNPEGISSGAYWFYFRFGFRSLNSELNKISLQEFEKIKNQKGYRSSEETLLRFTESNIALDMGKGIPLTVAEIRERVTSMISEKYAGNRLEAEKNIVKTFLQKAGKLKPLTKDQRKVLTELAFLAEVLQVKSTPKINLLVKMVYAKTTDLYEYQQLLGQFLK
jgi:hypothetical protein